MYDSQDRIHILGAIIKSMVSPATECQGHGRRFTHYDDDFYWAVA